MKRKAKLSLTNRKAENFANSVLLGDTAAGVLLSGDSGSGKSNAMQLLAHSLIRANCGVTCLDPHGDLADDLEGYCASLPARRRRRVVIVRYADTGRITGMNPLFVDRTGLDDLTYHARVVSRCGHVARVLLHAFGERDFHGKPLMSKFFFYYLTTLAFAGLTIADVRHFFDLHSPVYQALVQVAPDFVAQLELVQLADMRPTDREEMIGSTKNRFLNFLQNPIVELVLGKPDGNLDVGQLIRERGILIISLERRGVLRDEDVEIFANLWLHEILYAVYNTPRSQRVPHFLLLDELPTFGASFEVITRALAQVRKFLCRFVVAFQGTQLFEERENDRLLNALVGQCNVHFYFRHKHPKDAKFFGEIVKLPSIDTMKVKHVLTQQQQYQDGHDLFVLEDHGQTLSSAEQDGGSSSNAVSDTSTATHGTSSSTGTSTSSGRTSTTGTSTGLTRLADAVQQARTLQEGRSEHVGRTDHSGRTEQSGTTDSQATAHGTTQTTANTWSQTKTVGTSVTRKQTLVPRIRTREIVTGIQYFTTDEQFIDAASGLTRYARGTCLLLIAGNGVSEVQLPLAHSPLAGTPKFAARKLSALRREVSLRPEFDTPESLQRKRLEFERCLVQFLNDAARPPARLMDSDSTILLPRPTDENGLIGI